MNSWNKVTTLIRYWMKGRFTLVTAAWMGIGEVFAIALVLFIGGTFISFSGRFGLGSGVSSLGLSLIFSFFLVGLIQSGFNGSGLQVSGADVDYVFTSPVRPRELFAAKVLMNSFTTVLLSFPPVLALYLRFSETYQTGLLQSLLAGLVTLVFFVLCLVLSADITLSLNSRIGPRMKLVRNILLALVAVLGIAPVALLIPGAPNFIAQTSTALPSGLAAQVSYSLVSGAGFGLQDGVELVALGVWVVVLLGLGTAMARRNFYEVVQVYNQDSDGGLKTTGLGPMLETEGRSVWSVVRSKERVLMGRTKETRSLLINGLFLAGFMLIYSLSGVFLSSPTSFLFLLFIIGSFGSGNATRWLEKERLWLVKTSSLNLSRYVREVYRARVTPLLMVLSPVAAAVGVILFSSGLEGPGTVVSVGLALPSALEVAALMMAGGMYFAARYGQSSADDTLTSQGQDLADIRRFLYQTLINLLLVSPLMGLVLVAGPILKLIGDSSLVPTALVLGVAGIAYSAGILGYILSLAGRSLERREDL